MRIETKSLTVKAMNDEGRGVARIAILSAVDHDGDTYAPGAFGWKEGGQQWVSILPAHDRRAMPLGKARIYEEGDAAYAELFLNLNTEAGRNWHHTLKFDLEKGQSVQEWSYGFDVVEHANDRRDGQKVRVLKKLDVHEVSPVLRGAGVGTRTLSMKSSDPMLDQLAGLVSALDAMIEEAGSVEELRASGDLSEDRLAKIAELQQRLADLLADDSSQMAGTRDGPPESEAALQKFLIRRGLARFLRR